VRGPTLETPVADAKAGDQTARDAVIRRVQSYY
jgi:hypothetical protein